MIMIMIIIIIIRKIRRKFSKITEIAMLFQYS